MHASRRQFLQATFASALATQLSPSLWAGPIAAHSGAVKPRRLRPGATVGLVSPASATFLKEDMDVVKETVAALGLTWKLGAHALDHYGYLGGTDTDRAADLNAMFADEGVDAIFCVRGGWGCNRLLPLLDYPTIAAHPKVLLGYSDITALLNAIHAKTGLVTFHGPVGVSTWNRFSTDSMRRVIFEGERVAYQNPAGTGDNLVQVKDRVQTITPGVAQGPLLGGNLTVLTAMLGSDYLPDFTGAILVLEDVNEKIYRVDRMLTQLRLAGVLGKVAGAVFGKCTKCDAGEGYASLTLEEVLRDHLAPLKVPAFSGSMIGHIDDKFTIPIGVPARMDASAGTLTLLESAVR